MVQGANRKVGNERRYVIVCPPTGTPDKEQPSCTRCGYPLSEHYGAEARQSVVSNSGAIALKADGQDKPCVRCWRVLPLSVFWDESDGGRLSVYCNDCLEQRPALRSARKDRRAVHQETFIRLQEINRAREAAGMKLLTALPEGM